MLNAFYESLFFKKRFIIKMLKIMNITTIFLLICCLQASARVSSQEVTLNVKNTSLNKVFQEIKKQTGYTFIYTESMLKEAKKVTIRVKNSTLQEALSICFASQPFTYKIIYQTVVLQPKEKVEVNTSSVMTLASPPPIEIHGKVVNKEGNPLPNVSVLVLGTKNGTTTNSDGHFTLTVQNGGNIVLEISSVGYQTQRVKVAKQTEINVTLETNISGLSDIVVVGYGSQKKRDVIGSISTIKSDVFETPSGSTNFNSLLQGQAAGVSVQSSSGRLGASVDIKIRGLSSISAGTTPLWVIDGVPIVTNTGISNNGSAEQSPMDLINPADILSIDVLKDAAATSIYGSRGSNGVIIVTTKSGRVGKPSLNLSYDAGISELPFQKVNFLLDPKKWFEIKDEAKGGFGLGAFTMNDFYSKKVYATEFLTRQQAEGTSIDWIKKGTQQGNFQSGNFSVRGGNEAARYYISGLYRKDNSVMSNENLERYGLRANVDLKPLKSLLMGAKIDLAISKGNRGKNSSEGVEDGNKSGTAGGFSFLNDVMVPFEPVYSFADPSQYYNPYVENPVANSDPKNLIEALDMYRVLASMYAEYSIPYVSGLSFRSEVSQDIIQANRNFWVSAAIRHDGSYGEDGATSTRNLNYNFYLKYNRHFGDHSLDMVAGTESQRGTQWTRTMQGRNLVGTYQQLGTPSLIDKVFSGLSGENMLKSYFGRANYKYKDRYLAGISVRRDGSSVFTPAYRWGTFLALSAGWILSDEAFMGRFGGSNFLKLRGSYGQTGNASIPGNLDVTSYRIGFGYGSSDILGTDGTIVGSIVVRDLVWEKTNNLDVGLDFGFLNYRINGSLAYYNKYVHGLLLKSALPPSAGIGSIWGNIGDLVNTGVELSVTSYNLPSTRKFGWSTTLNVSFNHNEIKKLTPQIDKAGTGMVSSPFISKVGSSIREYYLAENAGIDPQTGLRMIYARDQDYYTKTGETRRLKDTNNKDVLLLATSSNMNSNFFHEKGKSGMPTYYGGISNKFTYKGFDLGFLVTFSGGNYILDNFWRDLIQNGGTGYGSIPASFVGNYWKKPGDVAKYQRLDWLGNIKMEDGTIVGMGDPRVPLDQWLFKGDFVKLKSVSLGYTFPASPNVRKIFQNLRLYCTLDNLYTITKYPGWDPEGQSYVQAWDLPQLFSASVGVNVNF
jgi:TonB-linked SusC/RagA family outer membrane protein